MRTVHLLKEECCGCSACVMKCPKNAIEMKSDVEGFLYPIIDEKKCINCGLCLQICSFVREKEQENIPTVYAVKNKNEKVRYKSSSGGMFTLLSDLVLKKKGYIVAAAFEKKTMKVVHTVMDNEQERDKAIGSKYVQSDLNNTFVKVKTLLEQGKDVMFVGTACQVQGLKNYLGSMKQEQLLLCDIVCHGAPSPGIWEEYIQVLNKQNKIEIDYAEFKNKETGWHTPSAYAYAEGVRYSIKNYQSIFCKDIILRPSCYQCPYTSFTRVSDITIGDFWGIERVDEQFDDNKGVSLVLINSEKGKKIFEKITSDIISIKSNIYDSVQPNLKKPTAIPKMREIFWKDYKKHGLEYVLKLYGTDCFKNRMKRKVKILYCQIKK